jgi:hypothetical protein
MTQQKTKAFLKERDFFSVLSHPLKNNMFFKDELSQQLFCLLDKSMLIFYSKKLLAEIAQLNSIQFHDIRIRTD